MGGRHPAHAERCEAESEQVKGTRERSRAGESGVFRQADSGTRRAARRAARARMLGWSGLPYLVQLALWTARLNCLYDSVEGE